jgi:hypothetical protein
VIPSGSKPNRHQGALVGLNSAAPAKIDTVSFSDLYEKLVKLNPELNIEGAVAVQDKILLFNRGNGESTKNQVFTLAMDSVLSNLREQSALLKDSLIKVQDINLGKIQDQPLSFTDAAIETPDHIWFLAVAEGGKSTYEDGEYFGAILGAMNRECQIKVGYELSCPFKPEGLALDFAMRKFFVVTDADDRNQASQLFAGQLPVIY